MALAARRAADAPDEPHAEQDMVFKYNASNAQCIVEIQRHMRAAVRLICSIKMGHPLDDGLKQCIQDMRVPMARSAHLSTVLLTTEHDKVVHHAARVVHGAVESCRIAFENLLMRTTTWGGGDAMNDYISWHLQEALRLVDWIVLEDGRVRLHPRPRAASYPN